MIKHVTAETFKQEVLESKVPYWWISGPHGAAPAGCRARFSRVWTRDGGDEHLVDGSPRKGQCRRTAGTGDAQFGVMSIPTLIVFKDGKAVAKEVGVRNEDQLQRMLMN